MDPNQTVNLNQNTAHCIQSASSFGHTIYTNICNGTVTRVDWGSADWALSFGFVAFGVVVIALFGGIVFMLFSDSL